MKALHEKFMGRCLQLAEMGSASVAPNPMVGAVLVYNDVVIGEGFHTQYGAPHAEVECLLNVSEDKKHLIAESSLYVSLEPCNHFGKTPPCTDLIIQSGIKKVIIACRDFNKKVNGSGIQKLQHAGIEITEGICEHEAKELNKRFFTFHQQQRPYIILKWAQSADGFIAAKDQRTKISDPLTDRLVHRWRSEEAAILVGTQTAIIDNPHLTTRLVSGKNPVRILIDKYLEIPLGNHMYNNEAPTIIINTQKQEEEKNIFFYKTNEEENVLAALISLMHQRTLTSLIVEGGTKTIQTFITAGLWDEVRIITNKSLKLTEGVAAPVLPSSTLLSQIQLLNDSIEFRKHD